MYSKLCFLIFFFLRVMIGNCFYWILFCNRTGKNMGINGPGDDLLLLCHFNLFMLLTFL